MKSSLKGFMLGVVTTCLMLGATVAYAAGGTQIEVYFEKLKYVFEGAEKQPTAEQGQGFIYKGTTYVPLRFVSESLGKEVGWNATSKTIWIGKQPENTNTNAGNENGSNPTSTGTEAAVYLTDLTGMTKEDEASMLSVNSWGKSFNTAARKPAYQIAGTSYKKGLGLYHHDHPYPPNIKTGGTVQYPLDGKYTKLTAFVGAADNELPNAAAGTIKFIGDGKELLVVDAITAGKSATPVDLDVTGIQVLRINFNSNRQGSLNLIVADPMVIPAAKPTTSTLNVQSDMIIVERDKKAEFVVLKNRGTKEIDLKGWKVISVNGQEVYPFKESYVLNPDSYVMLLSGKEGKSYEQTGVNGTEFRTYSRSLLWTTSEVWNDTESDAVELYNLAGVKVSEYIN
ncbi:hypothetical protein GCM10008018_26370 [Paenibacillus marchantiophytorum]|uniref:LTD domain-containing protein n=1 Tax=Paenibacillus marchantiophytorum TaxID=1619310 RepID=A0ABQ1EN71_9BACL|nr:NPCBM/NEW2 domain-containing protein [Paenibacillus marchantiophytorum]GFZ79575.1 hypothetical protein GCM10008018_26370 [Paenibacillus marchantiophytorum]